MSQSTATDDGARSAGKRRAADPLAGIADALAEISARLERLEATTQGLAHNAQSTAAAAIDTVDEAVRRAQQAGIDLEARLPALLALVEQLTRPQTLQALSELIALLEQVPKLVATAIDTLDGYAHNAREAGVDLEALVTEGGTLLGALTRAVADSRSQTLPTPLGVLRLLNDLEVRRTLVVLLSVAKQLGAALEGAAPTRR